MREKPLILAFVTHLSGVRKQHLSVTRWPDAENRSSPEIDALVGGGSVTIALEHTSVDSFPEQRAGTDAFRKLRHEIENTVSPVPKQTINIILPPTAKWNGVACHLIQYLRATLPLLPQSSQYHSVPGLGFPVFISKRESEESLLWVGRFGSTDPEELATRLEQTVRKKVEKLQSYRQTGHDCLLLIENDDLSLMNVDLMLNAVSTSLSTDPAPGIDEVWYADTSFGDKPKFRLLWPEPERLALYGE